MSTLTRTLRVGGRRRPRGARRRRARRRRHGQARRRLDHPQARRRHGQGPEGPRRVGHADHARQGRVQGRLLPDHRRHHRPRHRGRHDHPQRRPAAARRHDPRAADELHHRRRRDAVASPSRPARRACTRSRSRWPRRRSRAPGWAPPSRASPSSSAPRARRRSTRRSASRPSRAGCASGPRRSRPRPGRSPSPAERRRWRSIPAPRRRWPRWASSAAPAAPATANPDGSLAFPITGGKVDAKSLAGSITHSGGLTLTKGATAVTVTDFTIETAPAPKLTALLGTARFDLATLDLSAAKVATSGRVGHRGPGDGEADQGRRPTASTRPSGRPPSPRA